MTFSTIFTSLTGQLLLRLAQHVATNRSNKLAAESDRDSGSEPKNVVDGNTRVAFSENMHVACLLHDIANATCVMQTMHADTLLGNFVLKKTQNHYSYELLQHVHYF